MSKWNYSSTRNSINNQVSAKAEFLTKREDQEFYNKFSKQMVPVDPVFIYHKPSKAVHIKTFHGTVCRLENQGKHVINKLKTVSKVFPEGRTICQICDRKYFENLD